MKLEDFKLERYFAQHEFTAKHLLSSSDCDGYEMNYVLQHASEQEVQMWNNIKLGYTDSVGNPLLRESILQFYKTNSIDDVVVASPGELNFIAMNVILKAQDHVVAVSPAYQSLHEVIQSLGCELSHWTPNKDWEFDTGQLEELIQSNTKLIVINFPHNPTGSYLKIEQLEEIIALAEKHNLYVFSDEMYHKLTVDPKIELPPISDLYTKGISLWGTSKTFGMAGLRTGWLVCRDQQFLKKVISFKDYLSICSSSTSEILSIIALNHIDDFRLPNIKKIKQNIELFQEFSIQHKTICSFIPPRAGSTSFVELNIEETSLEFSNDLVEKAGVMTVPAEMFDFKGKYIRVGFGRAGMPKTLEALGAYLKR